jgi:hypothetical protein
VAHYLRDEHQTNLTIDEDALVRTNAVFAERWKTLLGDFDPGGGGQLPAFLSYVIRFDNKGYRVFDLATLLGYFRDADDVERVAFLIEDRAALSSGGNTGARLELRLDSREESNSFLTVTSGERDWVDSSFAAVSEAVAKSKNRNGWFRRPWTALIIQLLGVLTGFALSLWAAAKMAPLIAIENPFVISFVMVLLIFSNLWTYLNNLLNLAVMRTFPNIKFFRPHRDRIHWLTQALVGGVVVAGALFLLGHLFSFVGSVLGGFVERAK